MSEARRELLRQDLVAAKGVHARMQMQLKDLNRVARPVIKQAQAYERRISSLEHKVFEQGVKVVGLEDELRELSSQGE